MLPFLAVILNRNFRNLWLGQITSQIAINMMAFVLVLRIYETTTSNTAVSLLILVIGVPAILLGGFSGTFVDRADKRNILLVTNLVRMILLLGFFASSETLVWVYLLVLAISVSTQFFVPAEAPTIPKLVPKEFLLTANSIFTFTYYTSMISGFVLSGPALRFFGPHNVFLFLASLLALAAFFVSQLPKEEKKEKISFSKIEITRFWREFWAGINFIRSKKEIAWPLFLLTSSQALIACLASLTPGFAHRILAIEVQDASYMIMGPAAIGIILGSLAVGQFGHRYSKKSLIHSGIISAGIVLGLLSTIVHFKNIPLAVILLFLLGAANALIDVPANTALQENAPSAIRGRVYGFLTASVGGAAILPVMIIGIAADFFGVGKVIFTLGGVVFLYGIYSLTKERYNNKVLSSKY